MKILANIIGILAVVLFVLSYQQKTRRYIVITNILSRVFYVTQYMLLFAFSGAAMDLTGLLVSLLAHKKDKNFISKHIKLWVVASLLFIVAVGLLFYKDIFSILPIIAVIFEVGALWLTKEKHIRIVSLLSTPFWLVYNILCGAYGSAVGSVLAMVSIVSAFIRYDIRREIKDEKI